VREDRLSPRQRKELAKKREPYRHAYERLRERHMPDADYGVLDVLTSLANLAIKLDGPTSTARIVTKENDESWVVEVDAFTDRKKILIVMNPKTGIPRTVLP
jgi:hypothetical protein